MIKNITTSELPGITASDGLVLQGCGGPPEEWLAGVNELLTEAGMLLNGAAFKTAYVFEHEHLTNILFSFDDIKPGDINMGRLAIWRLQTRDVFGGIWLSDAIPSKFLHQL